MAGLKLKRIEEVEIENYFKDTVGLDEEMKKTWKIKISINGLKSIILDDKIKVYNYGRCLK